VDFVVDRCFRKVHPVFEPLADATSTVSTVAAAFLFGDDNLPQ
jgi:hypothetical protein